MEFYFNAHLLIFLKKEMKFVKEVGKGQKFDRIRRVTGYLSGTVDRFNNAKRAEEKDRVKHNGIEEVKKECKN